MGKSITFYLICLFIMAGCDSNDPVLTGNGSLKLVVRAQYDGKPLVQGQVQDYFGLGSILFTKADFFISALSIANNSDTMLVKDVDYISLMGHHVNQDSALNGLKLIYENLPSGEYHTLLFNVGLTAEQNKTKPVDYLPTHPLGEGTRYWAGWDSYIYSKTEGVFKNGSDHSFSYHSGFDDAVRALHFTHDFTIYDNEETSIEIFVDYKKLFEDNGNALDIPANPQIHNTSIVMQAFMDRYGSAIIVK